MRIIATGPGMSEIASIAPDVLDESMKIVTSLFRGYKFCYAVRYNVKRISITKRYAGGEGQAGNMEWEVSIQPYEAMYTMSAFIDISWDDEVIKIPAVFKDNQGNIRGFSDVSIKRFLYAGADLSEHIPPHKPQL